MHAFTTLLVLLPVLAADVSAIAVPNSQSNILVARNRHFRGKNNHANSKASAAASAQASAGVAAAPVTNVAATVANATAAVAAANNTAASSAAGVNATIGTVNNPDAQDSLTLLTSQIGSNIAQNGQAVQEAGQVPSLTSTNNFINFCETQSTTITNGLQTVAGSCNPIIMGRIVAKDVMPSSKFTNPVNGQTIKANSDFQVTMAVKNMNTGNFVNAATNYFAAPCQVDGQGQVIAHSHVVIEKINGFADTQATDPTQFAFFKGLNAAAVNGVLTADVTAGLPAGQYRLASINTCANHQPVLVAVAQHGSLDDMVYFNVA